MKTIVMGKNCELNPTMFAPPGETFKRYSLPESHFLVVYCPHPPRDISAAPFHDGCFPLPRPESPLAGILC